MKVLVTGGSGFIGSEIVRQLLRAKHEVMNVDCHTYAAVFGSRQTTLQGRSDYHLVQARVGQSAEQVAEFSPKVIIHAAAESHVDRAIDDASEFLTTNVADTYVLLETARTISGLEKFLYVSTDEVYGPWKLNDDGSGWVEGFSERAAFNPRNPYAATKAAAEHLCMSFFHTHKLPVTITRGANTYGPYQLPEKFLPMMIMRALRDESLPIYGDGAQTREWLHVRDHAEGILSACWAGEDGEAYNLGPGVCECNLHVAQEILRRLGKPESLIEHVEDRPGHDRDYNMDARKAATDIGWQAEEIFIRSPEGQKLAADGLQQTIDWITGDGHSWCQAAAAQGNLERKGLGK